VRLGVALAVLALAACGEAPEESGAERAVERRAGAEAECTSRSRVWFREGPPAKVLLCVARRGDGRCSRYRVDRDGSRYRVSLLAREGDCTLPPG
jgi:hypothetical protein